MRNERLTLDIDILAYCVETESGKRHELAANRIEHAVGYNCRLTLQQISESHVAVARKRSMPSRDAVATESGWLYISATAPSSRKAVRTAPGGPFFRYALVISTAAEASSKGARTEDLSGGAVLEDVRDLLTS